MIANMKFSKEYLDYLQQYTIKIEEENFDWNNRFHVLVLKQCDLMYGQHIEPNKPTKFVGRMTPAKFQETMELKKYFGW